MAKIGAVLVPVMPRLSGTHLTHLINQSDAETVVLDASFLKRFNAVANELESARNIIVDTRALSRETRELPSGAVLMEQLFESPADPPRIEVGYPDPAYIIYTSGTTGFPKGLVVRHPAPRTRGHEGSGDGFDMKPGEVGYTCYALPTCFPDFIDCLTGGFVAAFSREKRYDKFWDDIRKHNAVMFGYFADLIPALLRQPERKDDADNPARFCTGIMAPRDPATIAAFEKRFGVRVIETYGSMEAGGVTSNDAGKAGSIGRLLPDVDVKIVDDQGNEVAPHAVGEIVVRRRSGRPIAVEYYKMPEESARKTRNGWYHTDDLGYKDEDGYLYFADRKLDVIEKDGKHMLASAIEAVVSQYDGVAECAAVGVPSGPENDDIKLCVVCEEGKSVDPEKLTAFCAERMEEHMVPRYIEFRDTFPRSARGKVQRFRLRGEGVTGRMWDRHRQG
jgi:crotonobetaine/carnitine-CoA ligase